MNISFFGSDHLDYLQAQLSKNAVLIERGKTLMRIVSKTGEKGLSPQALIKVANMCADGSVVTGKMFLQLMNKKGVQNNGILSLKNRS